SVDLPRPPCLMIFGFLQSADFRCFDAAFPSPREFGGRKVSTWPIHGRITGPIVMIGFGSIGRGTLPMIERHFDYDKSRFVVIDPSDKNKFLLDERGIKLIQTGLTKANYREILTPLLTAGSGQGFCV